MAPTPLEATENVALVDPAPTYQDAGAVRTLGAELEIATETPPAGAGPLKVTVQTVAVLEASDADVHCSELTVRVDGAARFIAYDWVAPFN